jgi:hypothetical protein
MNKSKELAYWINEREAMRRSEAHRHDARGLERGPCDGERALLQRAP